MAKHIRSFESVDGQRWTIEVPKDSVGASNALIVFKSAHGRTARYDRYAWFNSAAPEARNVTTRLDPTRVLESLDDAQLTLLFRRSMPISATATPLPPNGDGR